jgi:hypothetical protein
MDSAKKVLILTMKLWKMKKSSDFDHEDEIMNLVEKNIGTPANASCPGQNPKTKGAVGP